MFHHYEEVDALVVLTTNEGFREAYWRKSSDSAEYIAVGYDDDNGFCAWNGQMKDLPALIKEATANDYQILSGQDEFLAKCE